MTCQSDLMFIKQTLKILTQFIGFIKCGILSHSEWNKEKKVSLWFSLKTFIMPLNSNKKNLTSSPRLPEASCMSLSQCPGPVWHWVAPGTHGAAEPCPAWPSSERPSAEWSSPGPPGWLSGPSPHTLRHRSPDSLSEERDKNGNKDNSLN